MHVLMRSCAFLLTGILFYCQTCLLVSGQAAADATAIAETKSIERIWRVGARITTGSKGCRSLLVTFPIPTDWPEQHVNLYKEEIPIEVRRADFRILDDGVKQMVAKIPSIAPNKRVEIFVLMEITVSGIAAPSATTSLKIPKYAPREVKHFLNPSPLINHRKSVIKRKMNEIIGDLPDAWSQIHAIHRWIDENIEVNGDPPEGAVNTLNSQAGPHEDRYNLFIAMCRSHRVPARMVWADNGEYAEFYLENEQDQGRWYPCILDGHKEFGSMSNPRVIIQKGENIKVPEENARQRFVVEMVAGKGTGGRPKVEFVRDLLPAR